MVIQEKIPSAILQRAQSWLTDAYDEQTRNEVKQLLAAQPEALIDAFYKDLAFGTGGMRGIMGVGTNRINNYTIAKATQGLSNYLHHLYKDKPLQVAIAFDSRNNSQRFAQKAAAILTANGIEVYIFDDLYPTPLLSFAVRYLRCQAGIMITASHNPKEYNGYKVYGEEGAQLVAPADQHVLQEVHKVQDISAVKVGSDASKIHSIDEEVVNAYKQQVLAQHFFDVKQCVTKDLKIVYTPLHGTGIQLIPKLLYHQGFKNVSIVEKQATPHGDFPTVLSPNPEDPKALELALQQAQQLEADLVIGTDPDADRVGIAVKSENGPMQLLNGHQTGALLSYYVLQSWAAKSKFRGNEFIVKTIVTTPLIEKIAAYFKVPCYNTLTGFKYIAAVIQENEGIKKFLLGAEESYGYLLGDFVRDKDGVSTACMLAEMAAWLKTQDKSIYTFLLTLYQKFGYYQEQIHAITQQGKQGAEAIKAMMQRYRASDLKSLNNQRIVMIKDYWKGQAKDLLSGKTNKIALPLSDVLQFITEDESMISIRPSGTEPKIKFYFSVKVPFDNLPKAQQQAREKLACLKHELLMA